ncbi:MAG: 30S ribosomal protein S12 methylthiotransferase RimO [Lentisphaerae bacterium]|mgnify:CR=1 FL=1|nr:30S ribosomal protein S12 methylthiotransferase RimO [Lentisphaerota bacterium]
MPRFRNLFCLVNLGCPKNTVDSEGILAAMSLAGFRFVADPASADICLVNTCGFLDAARREAAGVLHELAVRRNRRGRPLLVATGCLVERSGGVPELSGFLESADVRAGFADYPRLPDICRDLLAGRATARGTGGYAGRKLSKPYFRWLDGPRMRIGSAGSAYLKLGEGCSNNCAYCSIPLIRGRRASRTMKAILEEARALAGTGVKELNLIAQDTTAYGIDMAGKPQLAPLLRGLLKMSGELWFRILYAHPKHLTAEMLEIMASDPRVCPYLDLPLQHVNDRMLSRMGRGYGRKRVDQVLAMIRRYLPDAALRTTFITGHPGEGEREFHELLAFVAEGHFDHLGVFAWSPEPGTRSLALPGRVPPTVAADRRAHLMTVQARISARRLRARQGAVTTMLLEERGRDGWQGRTPWQAPEVDGKTVLTGPARGLRPGDFVQVNITRTSRYDCRARSWHP